MDESCINNGKIYSKETSGTQAASVAPTHTSGSAQGADGIKWWYVKTDTITSVSIRDITVRNLTLKSNRGLVDLANNTVTAGTDGRGIIDNVVFDSVSFPANYTGQFFFWSGHVGTINVRNTKYTTPSGKGFLIGDVLSGKTSWTELKLDSCDLTNTNGFLQFSAHAGTDLSFGKLTSNDTKFTGGYAVVPALACMNSATLNFTRCTFTALDRFMYVNAGFTMNDTIRLTDCTFATSLAYLIPNTQVNNVINYISTGTHYIDPVTNLFFNNQPSATVKINVSSSTGTVTQAKVRNGVYVTVTACDLPYN